MIEFTIDSPKRLKQVFKHLVYIELDKYLLFDNCEAWNIDTEETIKYKSLDEMFEAFYLQLKDFKVEIHYSGGRGAKSKSKTKMGGGFSNAGGLEKGESIVNLHPATFNTQGRFATVDEALRLFRNKYGKANIEYAVSIDSDGFIHKHVKGGKHSVAIQAMGKNHTISHNHPSGSNFSDTDLLSFSASKNESRLIATSSKAEYSIEKTSKFNAKKFARAVNRAKWPVAMNYDQGAHWWLKKNANKFGYKYFKKVTGMKSNFN